MPDDIKPVLTDEQIRDIAINMADEDLAEVIPFARAIERAVLADRERQRAQLRALIDGLDEAIEHGDYGSQRTLLTELVCAIESPGDAQRAKEDV